jgi:hypothetical protein
MTTALIVGMGGISPPKPGGPSFPSFIAKGWGIAR